MNMYSMYLKECWNRETIEWSFGFVSYEIHEETSNLHIHDTYILPERRHEGHYATIIKRLESIAQEHDLKYLTGDIYKCLPNMEQSVMAQIKNGGKFVHMDKYKVTMAKEL